MSLPYCYVNGQSTTDGYNTTAGSTNTISLIDNVVDSWTIQCTSTDELNTVAAVNATLVVDQIAKTATYTQPSTATGSALQWTSTASSGNTTSSTTFGTFVPGPTGIRLFFPGETNESSSQYGIIADLNDIIRNL